MTTESIIKTMYGIDGFVVILFYFPQIRAIWRDRQGAQSISIKTWLYWCVSQSIAVSYMAIVARDHFLMSFSIGHFIACATVVAVTVYRRRAYAKITVL